MASLPQHLLESRWLKALIISLVLSALAWQLSIAIWSIMPISDQMQQLPPASRLVKPSRSIESADYQAQATQIAAANLFGKVVAKPAEVAVTEAPSTTLKYKLRGIYYSDNVTESSVIVETSVNNSHLYRVRDELADNIFLASIERDHVLINRYGKVERLDLEKRLAATAESETVPSAMRSSDDNHQAILSSYKRRYASNPMALATRFQAIPVQENGTNVGFRLKPLRGESLLAKLDFESNDVFTSVNGASLANPFEALDALRSLTTADNVTVTFIRNGVPQTRDFRL